MKNKLTALSVKSATTGKHFDGGGLWLNKTDTGGNWLWRYSFNKARKEMGLGSLKSLSLSEARKQRDKWEAVLAEGIDPIRERQRQRDENKARMDQHDPTLEAATLTVFDAIKGGLRGEGARGRWLSPLKTHVFPKVGNIRLSTLHQSDLKTALQPIWKAKHPTAEKALQRVGVVLKQSRAMGLACDPSIVGSARVMLGVVDHEVKHIVSTPWQDIPALYSRLEGLGSASLALRWAILTCVRSQAFLGARFDEIDGDVWTVPAARIKGKKGKVRDFRVPLTAAAMQVVHDASLVSDTYLFRTHKGREGHITEAALRKELEKQNEAGRTHGFRASFKTWVQDTDPFAYDVAETILGHVVGGKVERSYARSDLLDGRRVMLDKWAAHVTGQSARVVKLRG